MTDLRGCDLVFAPDAADSIRAAIAAYCRCDAGRRCPLLPEDAGAVLVETAPRLPIRLAV